MSFISEDQIEQAMLQKLQHLHGYDVLDCMTADPEDLDDESGRTDKRDVILADRLLGAVIRLNPELPRVGIEQAVEKLTERRRAMSTLGANRELDALIRDGVPITFENADGKTEKALVKVIDFNCVKANDFLAVSQLWIKGELRFRRPDVILYINGLPTVFVELKNSNVPLKKAFEDNLTTYKAEIPQLFHANAFCVLSNALETKVGSFTAEWEHFFNWLRPDDEREKVDRKKVAESGTSLERVLSGLCDKERLLDYVENFVIYHKETQKIIAQNHQFIGVNRAIKRYADRETFGGKLGVFWHTQGSGKSFSMIFYARKIFRKFAGSPTFVVVTDRADLDGQIYRNFLNTGTVTKKEAVQPRNSKQMREYLGQNKRLVFTLIQKFRFDKGKKYPVLSDRDDIIVIVDEAHRTQYKSLAENMRKGLPNAQYLAFTGTPLLGRDRKTNKWFGDYVSEYNFAQSMDDGATVPLFYKKRVPEVLIQNEDLSDEFYEILEEENLDEAQQEKLEKRYAKETEVIVRDDRLDTIAADIVYHFPRRGYLGKGMVISLDKFTAVKMYDKVQARWNIEIKELCGQISQTADAVEKERLKKRLTYMRSVDMAVVISAEAGEEKKFADKKLNIKPHRDRLETLDKQGHDVEFKFKDPQDPLQLVFVCAMWLTGFDVPTLSTLYLDKPMRDHTLMQAITRANRVSSFLINKVPKRNGEVVDYYNVFRNMKKALADYGNGEDAPDGESPVQEKSDLFDLLDDALREGLDFCKSFDVDLTTVLNQKETFDKLSCFKQYADVLLETDERRKTFVVYDNTITALYEACKPEILTEEYRPLVFVFQYLRGVLDSIVEQTDIESACRKISDLLDQSVVTDKEKQTVNEVTDVRYQIVQKGKGWDLSQIDFDKLKAGFKAATYRNIEIADLRAFIENKLEKMLEQNVTRADFAQHLQEIIDRYNSGGSSTENYYDDLLNFTKELREEDERHIREGLTVDELELFDLLKKEKMTVKETQRAKLAARDLLKRLLEEQPSVLVQDWFRDEQSKIKVKHAVEEVLDKDLPKSYDRVLFVAKCEAVFNLVYEHACKGRKWAA